MPELRDLPDLARDVRERAVPPPYAEVGRRVRARRTRGLAGTLAATVLLVGGVAVWQSIGTSPGPGPAEPATPLPSTSEALWRSVVDGEMAGPFEVAGSDDGSVAVVWRSLVHPEPTFALVIRHPDGTVSGTRLDEPVELTPVPGGWIGVRTTQGWFIDTDGTWTDLGTPGPSRQPRRGDVFVDGQFGQWLYSPQDRTLSWMPQPYGDRADGHVTPGGDLVTCGADHEGTVRVFMGEQQQGPDLAGDTCVIEGNGSSVLVAALGDDPNGDIPLEGVLLSVDGGRTWTERDYQVMSSVSSLAVLADGAWATTSTSGDLFVAFANGLDGASFAGHGVAFSAGDRIYTLSYSGSKGPFSYTDDEGMTWRQIPAPGMGSNEE